MIVFQKIPIIYVPNFSFFSVPNDDVRETNAVNTTTYDWEQNSTLTDAQASTITIQFTSIQKDITK